MLDTMIDANSTTFLFILYIFGGILIGYVIWSELYSTQPSTYKGFTYKELERKILKELGSDALYAIETKRIQRGIDDVESLVPIIVEYIYTHDKNNFNALIDIFHFQEEIPLRIKLSLVK